jgi:CheY-like chemotaxis protein
VRLAVAKIEDGVGVTTVDFSERYRAEEALRQADRQKDEFLAMLAHELRNPLAPIRAASTLLARLSKEPQSQRIVEIVQRQVEHMTRLVDDLLDVSRITQGRIVLQKSPIEVAGIIRQAVETVEPLIRERHHDLQVHSSYPALYVEGDPSRLVQTFINLLTNAAKYTNPGGEIHVSSRSEGGFAVIAIGDNGTGISHTLLPRIFDLFVQGDRTLDRAQGGLGVGLSVVRQLVEMHGGEVQAKSDGIGRGSTFTVRLPLTEAPAVPDPAPAQVKTSVKRILIVDDNEDAANTLAMILRLDGHDTHVSYSGRDALQRLEAWTPDLVLLDIGLPGMDGYEVANAIRERLGGASPRLIALTGYGQPEDRERALKGGFDDHLVKPVSPETISALLAGWDGGC